MSGGRNAGYDQLYVNNNTPKAIEVRVVLPQIKNPRTSLYHSIHFGDPENEGDPYCIDKRYRSSIVSHVGDSISSK
jgi:hypothetical protein